MGGTEAVLGQVGGGWGVELNAVYSSLLNVFIESFRSKFGCKYLSIITFTTKHKQIHAHTKYAFYEIYQLQRVSCELPNNKCPLDTITSRWKASNATIIGINYVSHERPAFRAENGTPSLCLGIQE